MSELRVHTTLEGRGPAALAAALDADPALRGAFDALSYSVRKEHARTVAEAKQDATRERRVGKIIEALRG